MKKLRFLLPVLFACGVGFACYYAYKYLIENDDTLTIVFVLLAFFSMVLALVSIFRLKSIKKNKKLAELSERVRKWNDFSYHVTGASDEAILKLPVGIVSFAENYEIMWCNPFAKEHFKSDLIGKQLSIISDELITELDKNKGVSEDFIFAFEDKHYLVKQGDGAPVLYFFDVTELYNLTIRYNNHITSIGVIEIDNLEASLKGYDVSERSSFRTQILGAISDWATKYNCYLQMVSDDKMIIVTNKEALLKMISDKVSVLSSVREICQNSKIRSSLSIGIACYDVDAADLALTAQSAIELAERRGGDQAVVNIQGQEIQFFGGATNSTEKNNMVEVRQQTNHLKESIMASDNVIIMCHNRADADAIGSMLCVYHLVLSSNKDVVMAFDPDKADVTTKRVYEMLKEEPSVYNSFVSLESALQKINERTLLIVTDTQGPSLVMFPTLLQACKRLCVIDHHRAKDPYDNPLNYYLESSASSSVELVTEMFAFYGENYEDNLNISPLEASIMLTGVVVDTNNFTFRAGKRTFDAAATLKGMGADMGFVKKLLRDPIDVEKKLASAFMKTVMVADKFAFIKLDEDEIITDRSFLAKISDKELTIEGVEASFTIAYLMEDGKKKVGVSARSISDINVSIIMEEIGGGGHYNSAAAQLGDTTIDDVFNKISEIVKRDYTNGGDVEMKIILTKDVKGKGKKNDIITVAAGYGNYLITNGQAVADSTENEAELNKVIAQEKLEAENKRNVLKKLASDIDGKYVSIYVKVGPTGKLTTAVTPALISKAFNDAYNILIDKKKITFVSEINSIGSFKAKVKLASDIVPTFEINVEEEKKEK